MQSIGYDCFLQFPQLYAAEKSGNTVLLRDIFLQQHRYVMAIAAAVDEAVLNVRVESIYCFSHFGAVVADELQPLCPSFRQRVVQFLSCLGCDLDGGAAGIGAWCERHPVLSTKNTSSKDGLRHRSHHDAWFAMVCAVLSLASPGFDTQWTSSLPPPTSRIHRLLRLGLN